MSAPPAQGDRAALWARFGPPSQQVGSVNDPRTQLENGVRWNEKWIYHRGSAVERVILWNRYDLVGVFSVAADGSLSPEAQPPP